MSQAQAPSTAGLREASRQVLASLVEIGHTRLELAAVELEEQRVYVARLWLHATCTVFLLFVSLVLAAAFAVLWCEPVNRLTALGVITAAFVAAAAFAAWRWHAITQGRPRLWQATLGELDRDRHALLGRHP